MDYARKIGKPDKPRTWKRTRMPVVTTRDSPLSAEDTVFTEDHRLVNWKKWLEDRKKQTRHIEFATGRSHADQLHSSTERFRELVEMKDLMEHATIPVPVIGDKYRGGPEFWRTSKILPDRSNACLPQVSFTPTRKELNLPPDLMQVGLPDLIAKERDLIAVKAKEESWKRSKYLKTRELELAEEITLLLPKKPETATLFVQGHALKKKKPLLKIPPITISEPEEDLCKDVVQIVVLKIQDHEFIWQETPFNKESKDIDPITWSLIFSSEIGEQVEREIVLENKGNRVIVYYWRDSSFQSNSMSFEMRGSPFFFNKTKGLILPGQIVKIKVWFLCRSRGIFTESWRFVTEPRLSLSAFVFRFWGCSNDTQDAELINHRKIDEYLNFCIRDSVIYSIIKEIITNVEHSEFLEPIDKMQLSQNNLFISQNKYNAVYNVLVTFANLFEDESELAKKNSSMKLITWMDVTKQKSLLLQRSNNNSQETQNEKLIDRSPIIRLDQENESFNLKQPYREILFTRIYKALDEAIKRACASIDSLNRLNELNKQKI